MIMHTAQGLEPISRDLSCHQQHTGVSWRINQFDVWRQCEMPQCLITLHA
ncbi:hypothetical protein ACFO0U_03530 [Chromohalobacter sarecensis]|uniref:Uncharacterized protein n=1 Tax=Chromohalobacter sarecensis TaxID=245294 RepID=A0ABV9CXV8_9GAMM|nr:hypothetical protein [Chromohalobacter sarecensis]MCK0714993.1 hypothetical protein [Chromohalobacter sarecensis]